MTFVETNPDQLPLALLLEADPAELRIAPYFPASRYLFQKRALIDETNSDYWQLWVGQELVGSSIG